jgi:hypothetical protein
VSEYGALRLVNAMVIGYMLGTREVIGRGGAQAIANMAGEYAGRELVRFARLQGESLESVEDLVAYVRKEGLADQMAFEEVESGFEVQIAQCYICPKKVGHYQFDGTACPWGGILIGALSDILETSFSCSTRLTPGETCTLHLERRQGQARAVRALFRPGQLSRRNRTTRPLTDSLDWCRIRSFSGGPLPRARARGVALSIDSGFICPDCSRRIARSWPVGGRSGDLPRA